MNKNLLSGEKILTEISKDPVKKKKKRSKGDQNVNLNFFD